MRWFWDREDGKPGLTRRTFLFLGGAATAAGIVLPKWPFTLAEAAPAGTWMDVMVRRAIQCGPDSPLVSGRLGLGGFREFCRIAEIEAKAGAAPLTKQEVAAAETMLLMSGPNGPLMHRLDGGPPLVRLIGQGGDVILDRPLAEQPTSYVGGFPNDRVRREYYAGKRERKLLRKMAWRERKKTRRLPHPNDSPAGYYNAKKGYLT